MGPLNCFQGVILFNSANHNTIIPMASGDTPSHSSAYITLILYQLYILIELETRATLLMDHE